MSGRCVNSSAGRCRHDDVRRVARWRHCSFHAHQVPAVEPQVVDDVVVILQHRPTHSLHDERQTQAVITTCKPTSAAHFTTLRPFDLRMNACWGPAIKYNCTKFGVDSLRRFSFIAQTDTHTHSIDATDHFTHASARLPLCETGRLGSHPF